MTIRFGVRTGNASGYARASSACAASKSSMLMDRLLWVSGTSTAHTRSPCRRRRRPYSTAYACQANFGASDSRSRSKTRRGTMKSTSSTASTSTGPSARSPIRTTRSRTRPTSRPPRSTPNAPASPMPWSASSDRRRALERRQRVQHDVLVHEHEMIVTCARRAEVECGACGRERAVAVVDQDVVEIVDLGAMALDRAVETLLAHGRVVEHADDRDWTSRRRHAGEA